MRVACEIDETMLTNENGFDQAGVCATCSRCGHTTESFGTGSGSRQRCLFLMRNECPNDESNYYFDSEEE